MAAAAAATAAKPANKPAASKALEDMSPAELVAKLDEYRRLVQPPPGPCPPRAQLYRPPAAEQPTLARGVARSAKDLAAFPTLHLAPLTQNDIKAFIQSQDGMSVDGSGDNPTEAEIQAQVDRAPPFVVIGQLDSVLVPDDPEAGRQRDQQRIIELIAAIVYQMAKTEDAEAPEGALYTMIQAATIMIDCTGLVNGDTFVSSGWSALVSGACARDLRAELESELNAAAKTMYASKHWTWDSMSLLRRIYALAPSLLCGLGPMMCQLVHLDSLRFAQFLRCRLVADGLRGVTATLRRFAGPNFDNPVAAVQAFMRSEGHWVVDSAGGVCVEEQRFLDEHQTPAARLELRALVSIIVSSAQEALSQCQPVSEFVVYGGTTYQSASSQHAAHQHTLLDAEKNRVDQSPLELVRWYQGLYERAKWLFEGNAEATWSTVIDAFRALIANGKTLENDGPEFRTCLEEHVLPLLRVHSYVSLGRLSLLDELLPQVSNFFGQEQLTRWCVAQGLDSKTLQLLTILEGFHQGAATAVGLSDELVNDIRDYVETFKPGHRFSIADVSTGKGRALRSEMEQENADAEEPDVVAKPRLRIVVDARPVGAASSSSSSSSSAAAQSVDDLPDSEEMRPVAEAGIEEMRVALLNRESTFNYPLRFDGGVYSCYATAAYAQLLDRAAALGREVVEPNR